MKTEQDKTTKYPEVAQEQTSQEKAEVFFFGACAYHLT